MEKLVKKYNNMTTYVDLKRNKLTKADYDMLGDVLTDMISGQIVTTIYKSVAEWCKRNGAKVTEVPCGWAIKEK